LKEQMRMYEVASQCNAILASNKSAAAAAVNSSTANPDDSYSQLRIKKSSGTVTSSRLDDTV